MTFSDTVAQQRDKQERNLKRFVTYSLAGSFLLHNGFLLLRVHDIWQADVSKSEEIAIVVTEPSEDESAEVMSPEESISEPGESGFAERGGDGSGDVSAATIIESPAASQASTPETPVEEKPIVEEEPESRPAPVTGEIAHPTTEDVTEAPETPLAESNEDVSEPAPQPRNLNSLLEDLRRAREQTRGNGSLGEGDRNSTAAAETGSRFGFGQSSGTGSDRGNGSGSGTGSGSGQGRGTESARGNETGTGSGQGNAVERGSGANRGSRSREISCRGCDFDYPEEADGVEGTAQIVVETDSQGRVVSVMLSRSSGNAALDRAALAQARQRVQLNNARAGESYPIDIDFVQPGSESARRVRQRGDRRSITVSEPEPETTSASESSPESVPATESPATTSRPSPISESAPPTANKPSASPEPESSVSPTSEQAPSRTPEAKPSVNSSTATPEAAPVPPAHSEPATPDSSPSPVSNSSDP